MNNKNNILEELQGISPAVANISNINVYTVPVDYFENFANNILFFVRDEKEIVIPAQTLPYSVPVNYFNGLAEQILLKAKQQPVGNEVSDELESIAPTLNTISKAQVYSVPDNYFENISITPGRIKQPGKLKALIGGGNKVFKYAVAAAVAGVMAISGLVFFQKDTASTNNPAISSNYKPEEIKKLSDEEIIDFLNSNSSDVIATSTNDNQPEDIQNSLKDVSDQEIKQYLQENAEPEETHSKEG